MRPWVISNGDNHRVCMPGEDRSVSRCVCRVWSLVHWCVQLRGATPFAFCLDYGKCQQTCIRRFNVERCRHIDSGLTVGRNRHLGAEYNLSFRYWADVGQTAASDMKLSWMSACHPPTTSHLYAIITKISYKI